MTFDEPGKAFLGSLSRDFRKVRVAWSRDLGGLPMDPRVVAVLERHRDVFTSLGCIVEDAEPDFAGAKESFETLRALGFLQGHGDHYRDHMQDLKDTVIWNIEQGLKLTGLDVSRAEAARAALVRRVSAFLERYEFLVLPVSQVAPFPVDVEWVKEINGMKMATYIDWMGTCYAISLTGLPAISVPCGFTPDGLPIGLQIVGRQHRDLDVLKIAYAFEQATQVGKRRAPLVGG